MVVIVGVFLCVVKLFTEKFKKGAPVFLIFLAYLFSPSVYVFSLKYSWFFLLLFFVPAFFFACGAIFFSVFKKVVMVYFGAGYRKTRLGNLFYTIFSQKRSPKKVYALK